MVELRPRISVVLPIDDDRGELAECLKAWLSHTYPPDEFDFAMPTDGPHPELGDVARNLAAARGRLLPVPGAVNERHLFDAGVRAANAPLLILDWAMGWRPGRARGSHKHGVPATWPAEQG